MSTMFSSPVSISPALVPRIGARADLLGVLAGDRDDLVGHDRPGREVQARLADAVAAALAEGQLDRLLLRPHRVERHQQPERRPAPSAISIEAAPADAAAAAARAAAPAAAAAAAHQDLQLLLALAHDLVDVGHRRLAARPAAAGRRRRRRPRARGRRPCRRLAAAAPGAAVVAVGHPPPRSSRVCIGLAG